jgi:hypothetical protein
MKRQEVPGPCVVCGDFIEDGDLHARDADGRLYCLSCYDPTAPREWDKKLNKWKYPEPLGEEALDAMHHDKYLREARKRKLAV